MQIIFPGFFHSSEFYRTCCSNTFKMKRVCLLLIYVIMAAGFMSYQKTEKVTYLNTESLQIGFDGTGHLLALTDKNTGKNYLIETDNSPLLSLRMNDSFENPVSLQATGDTLILTYPSGVRAFVLTKQNANYVVFKLFHLEGETSAVELALWGPYNTIIRETIGETIGVVRNHEFALGLQTLNIKTIGGFPWKENDCMPQIDIFEQDDPTDISEKNKRYVLYRVEAAKPTETGSSLQAYCRNRYTNRIIENLGYEKYVAPAWHDGGVIGSAIALFGCPADEVLETIGKIEVAEGLPHPMINGQWAKISPEASSAYIIMNFDEDNIDRVLNVTKKAGLKHLYHSGPFKTWGHFVLNDQFPNEVAGLKKCVEKAKAQGISIGVHTLSNFITTNDAYVTPVPDKRLARVGSSVLTKDIDALQTGIEIQSPEFFNEYNNSNLKTAMIGEELIRFKQLSDTSPWTLTSCERGAFGTKSSDHSQGDTISLLADHGYKVFLTNAELTEEVAHNIARLFNETGLCQISFDGLEGNRSTALGNYGESLMPYTWYTALTDEEKENLIIDASRTTHFFWHIYTRMNWGEPWYAGFRESQTEYRMKNQDYFQRNLMPGMLGWFSMRPEMSLEDMEWMLARSAAYDAGYAFVTSFDVLEKHGQSDQILDLIKRWEKARMNGAFPDMLKKEMENLDNEYHLKTTGENTWNLYRVNTGIFYHTQKEKQPGEPHFSSFTFSNPYQIQPLTITIQAMEDTECRNIKLEMDNYRTLIFPVKLSNGQILKYEGRESAILYDKYWNYIRTISIPAGATAISHGEHSFTTDTEFKGGEHPEIKLEVKVVSAGMILKGEN